MKRIRRAMLVSAALLGVAAHPAHAADSAPVKPRLVITADPELDDVDSLIRAMVYMTDFDLEGLVYQESTFHWKGDGKGTTLYTPVWGGSRLDSCPQGCTSWRWPYPQHEKFIDTIVDAYAAVYPNLKVHDQAYPAPDLLKSKIKWGNVSYPGDFSEDTDGSKLIKALLLDDKPGPLYVTAQGGKSTIARALRSIYEEYHGLADWISLRDKVSHKLIIIPWGDQDGLFAQYIQPNWPGVTEWRLAMVEYGYGVRVNLSPENKKYVGGEWTRANITSRGPLGALYRVWGDGQKMDPTDTFFGLTPEQAKATGRNGQEKDAFISEGDTPTFLNLLNNGLRAENGWWGGWGGMRDDQASQAPAVFYQLPSSAILPIDSNGVVPGLAPAGIVNPNIPNPAPDVRRAPANFEKALTKRVYDLNNRFFAASQNDFAARMKWSVTANYRDANHAPVVTVNGPLTLIARAGTSVAIQGAVSDPDRNRVMTRWWQYNDAGTYRGDVTISDPGALRTSIAVPRDAKSGDTIHLILEATDDGAPALTRYQRVVITVQ